MKDEKVDAPHEDAPALRRGALVELAEALCTTPRPHIKEAENFIAQAYHGSIGYCVPAALGVSLARPGKRPFAPVGDGAFHMTAQELSSLIRFHSHPVIFLLNNRGNVIERKLNEDGLYDDIQNWRFNGIPAIFGENSVGLNVKTEGDLEKALRNAKNEARKQIFIELSFPSGDCSPPLQAVRERLKSGRR